LSVTDLKIKASNNHGMQHSAKTNFQLFPRLLYSHLPKVIKSKSNYFVFREVIYQKKPEKQKFPLQYMDITEDSTTLYFGRLGVCASVLT